MEPLLQCRQVHPKALPGLQAEADHGITDPFR